MCFYLCRRNSGTRTESFTAAVLVYAGLLVYSTPIASTNGLGLFLFLAAITIPWIDGFSTRSLAVSIVIGTSGFLHQAVFHSVSWLCGFVSVSCRFQEARNLLQPGCIGDLHRDLGFVTYTSPYYLEATVFAVQSSTRLVASDEHLMTQVWEFVQVYLPLIVMLIVAVVYTVSQKSLPVEQSGRRFGAIEIGTGIQSRRTTAAVQAKLYMGLLRLFSDHYFTCVGKEPR